jgi:23S rRNA (uracil1939-C5)-methyltransferase
VGDKVLIGFNAEMSHRVVDMHECHVLRPELFTLVAPLRALLAGMLQPKRVVEIQLTLIDGGVDVLIKGIHARRLDEIERLTAFALAHDIARLSVDRGLGPETLFEPQPATVTLAGTRVAFPHGSFLQATEDGEAALIDAALEGLAGCSSVADLFAGLGTFALATRAAYAAEASRDAAAALQRSAPATTVEHRDLYRRPLDAKELKRFDGIILDPPRAGAEEQVLELSRSKVRRLAYVSCNPATFARDAKRLVGGGFALDWVQPVGQFRWSTHVELAATFSGRG